MRAALVVCALWAAGWGNAAGTTPYEGGYLPEEFADGALRCAAAGPPDGLTSIAGDEMVTTLYACRLSNPVAVRGMDATLYDAAGWSDSETGGGRVMLTRAEGRLLVNWGGTGRSG